MEEAQVQAIIAKWFRNRSFDIEEKTSTTLETGVTYK